MTDSGGHDHHARAAASRRALRRERLMGAGLELFGTQGFEATSIDRLCAAAGLDSRAFQEEFASREELLVALHARILDRARAAVTGALARERQATVHRRIEIAVTEYLQITAGDPRWARLAYTEVVGAGPEVDAHRERWRSWWIEFFVAEAERAVERGEAHPRDFRLGAVAVLGAVNELVRDWSSNTGIGDGERRDGGHQSHRAELAVVVAEVVRLGSALLYPPVVPPAQRAPSDTGLVRRVSS